MTKTNDYTVTMLSALLGKSKETIRNMIKRGELQGQTTGAAQTTPVIIPRESVLQWRENENNRLRGEIDWLTALDI